MRNKESNRGKFWQLFSFLLPSLAYFRKNDPLRMAGATAFFTTFALPPIIFILAQLLGAFTGNRTIGRSLIEGISNTIGEESANQVRQVIRGIRGFSDSWYVVVFGFLFLFFVATTLFSVIKDSLNQIWQISIKERPGLLFFLGIRLRSFAVILLAGLLFFADLLVESIEVLAGRYFAEFWEAGGKYFGSFMNEAASIVIVATWFILLFRFLADGRPSWRACIIGGLLTGILFSVGRLILRSLLVNSNIGNLYGASGSFVLILLFVFYSSFILYYGACFIAVYSEKKRRPIVPAKKAYNYTIKAVPKNS